MNPTISIIAAIGKNNELGKDNKLLWQIPEDMKRFKELTTGHPVIMGQKTYQSIGKPLPGRLNIVLTRDNNFKSAEVEICNTFEDAIDLAKKENKQEIFIIGGGQVYKQAIEFADKIYLTQIEKTHEADTFFPDYSKFTHKKMVGKGEYNGLCYKFMELTK